MEKFLKLPDKKDKNTSNSNNEMTDSNPSKKRVFDMFYYIKRATVSDTIPYVRKWL